ncbi:hypothetical protein K0C01_05025 [Salinarchaeum sp. IM2453]|uniref:hypothetical protein n=1 Tax=Salinarchaeum sp. IM2453 TaxID=2862870 RepID=UPI001C8364FD|nr:hypothetical protein [Salinarchaeum sp. IM2453]QZA89500.1 hypothetical protein K0C01_05025 [Salinarchaeum sp. IM2453]
MIRKSTLTALAVALMLLFAAPAAAAAVAEETKDLDEDETLVVDIEFAEEIEETESATITVFENEADEQLNESVVDADAGNWTTTEFERVDLNADLDANETLTVDVEVDESTADLINQTEISVEEPTGIGLTDDGSVLGVIVGLVVLIGIAALLREDS